MTDEKLAELSADYYTALTVYREALIQRLEELRAKIDYYDNLETMTPDEELHYDGLVSNYTNLLAEESSLYY